MNDRFSVHAIGDRAETLVQRLRCLIAADLDEPADDEGLAQEYVDVAVVVSEDNRRFLAPAIDDHADANLFRLYVIDDTATGALDTAEQAIRAARDGGTYFVAALCLGSIEDSDKPLQGRGYAVLQTVADALIFVSPNAALAGEDAALSAAVALLRTVLPMTVNLICVDVADIKHLFAGIVVTVVCDAAQPVASAIEGLGRFTALGTHPHATFCAYTAPPTKFDLSVAVAAVADRVDDLEGLYPHAMIALGVAYLVSTPVASATELITWVAFPRRVSETDRREDRAGCSEVLEVEEHAV